MPTSTDTAAEAPAEKGSLITRAMRLTRKHAGELSRFVGVGGTAYIIDLGLFNLCLLGFAWPDWGAKILATVVATSVAFFGNRHWTWRDRIGDEAAHRQYALYFFFNGIGLLISLGFLWANNGLAQVWPQYFDNAIAKNIAANFLGVGVATVFRFFAYRTWVFRHTENA
ncbi:GtrA family protein [Glycomyces buryatensis]|nr:GtrA family protein [Glycomyces buryatensis]